jgi:hypothetical protein
VNENIVVTILNERKAALTLDMCDIAVDVDAALDLHLLQHRVDQNVNSHRFGAATGTCKKRLRQTGVARKVNLMLVLFFPLFQSF